MSAPDNLRPRRARKKVRSVAPTADKALAEALSIVRDARDADEEIPWRRDPANEQDAALRAAIIRRIAADHYAVLESGKQAFRQICRIAPSEEQLANDAAHIALHVRWKLEELLPDRIYDDSEEDEAVGCDLKDAIEHWRKIEDENFALAKRLERQRVIREAKADIS